MDTTKCRPVAQGFALCALLFLSISCSSDLGRTHTVATAEKPRDVALEHIRSRAGDDPMVERTTWFTVSGLATLQDNADRVLPSVYARWQAKEVTVPHQGKSTVEFSSGNWLITVSHSGEPVETRIHHVTARNVKVDWDWEGKIGPDGTVEDIVPVKPLY